MTKRVYSKIDSARLQLDQTIALYSQDGDEASIYTLTAAVRGILGDLLNRTGKKSSEDLFLDRIKPSYKASMRSFLRKHQNYFNHADEDPDALLEFDDGLNDLAIMLAVNDFRELTGIVTEAMDVYALWYITHHPNTIVLPQTPEVLAWAQQLEQQAQTLEKKFFFDNVRKLPGAEKVFPYFYRPADIKQINDEQED